jgi:hypothetical protein
MRARIVGRDENAHAAGAIDNRDRDRHVALGAFRDRRLGNLEAEPHVISFCVCTPPSA